MQSLSMKVQNLWAKKRTGEDQQLWLPLLTHLLDTAQTSHQLFTDWLSEGQRALLTGDVGVDTMQKLVIFIGFTHDIGKATPAFQLKQSYDHNQGLDQDLIERLIRDGFAHLDETDLANANKSPHAKAGEALLNRFGVHPDIAAIIGGHHGKPLDNTPTKDIRDYTANYWQHDNDPAQQKPWQDVQQELFDYGLAYAGFDSVNDIPAVTQSQAILLEGLLIMADWLASSETLSGQPAHDLFPLVPMDHTFANIDETERFQHAWLTWRRSDEWPPEPVRLTPDPYQARWGFAARPVQETVTTALGQAQDPGIVIVEAPMGMGKTELALVTAEQLAYTTKRSGLFFGLPTQATSNAMFRRVLDWMHHVPSLKKIASSIELMHGKARFNPDFEQLPRASNIDTAGAITVNTWFSGKKTILNSFSVGTVDHLLLMALKQKHLALRHLGLSKKVVVIDEVHAYDMYMNEYLARAIEWLGSYHVPVILLSATLPKSKRNRLLEVYYKGKYGHSLGKHADLSQVSAQWRASEAYPLVSYLDGPTLHQITEFPGTSDQSPLTIQVQRLGADNDELVEAITQAIAAGGVAGVIVNTVKRAQELAEALRAKAPTLVLHSAFLAPDRTKREEQLQSMIGKGASRPNRLVVIGTQVLEQSLDIDFDILFTDIAPMDLLLQRAGRLHRHNIPRPPQLAKPRLVVIGATTPGDYGEQNEHIYEPYLLMRTDAQLATALTLPTDISRLVQLVYEATGEPAISEITAAKETYEQDVEKEQDKAWVFQLAEPTKSKLSTLHGWLKNYQPEVDHNDVRASAAVRDIAESIEVILIQRVDHELRLIDGRPLATCSEREIAEQLIRLPTAVTRNMKQAIEALENITSQSLSQWQESPWLKGALAVILNENADATLLNWQLHYSPETGLSHTLKEASNGRSNL